MADVETYVPLVIAITIGAVFFVPVVDVIDQNSGEVVVTNETLTTNSTGGESLELQGYDLVSNNETIEYDSGSGFTTASEGTDYSIDETNGTVTILSGGNIADGSEVRADYSYSATDGTTGTITDLLPLFMALLLLVPLANAVRRGM